MKYLQITMASFLALCFMAGCPADRTASPKSLYMVWVTAEYWNGTVRIDGRTTYAVQSKCDESAKGKTTLDKERNPDGETYYQCIQIPIPTPDWL
tara:strand:- start:1753 stop:2037 length:285 start_codon:yes stop_codon:yes gene_type:complete